MLQVTQSYANYDTFDQPQPCRICLQNVNQDLRQYCQCRGHLKPIHEQCLKQWAIRAQKYKDDHRNIYILCQLCKTRIYLNVDIFCYLKNGQQICKSLDSMKCQVGILMTIIVVFLVTMFVSLIYYFGGNGDGLFLLVVMGISGFMVFVSAAMFISRVFMKWKQQICGFMSISEVVRNAKIANSNPNPT